jgi:hypothetical protein
LSEGTRLIMKRICKSLILPLAIAALLVLTFALTPSSNGLAQSTNDPVRSAIWGIGPKLPSGCRSNGGKFSAFLLTVTDGSNLPGGYRCTGNAWSGPFLNSTGSGSTVKKVISATASLDFTALAANTCEELTVASAGTEARTTYTGFVSATNTVTVRRCNSTGSTTANPAAATVRVSVTQF